MELMLSCTACVTPTWDSWPHQALLVTFNLGYLPGSDKVVVTTPEKTLASLEAATSLLSPGGLISLLVYLGHEGGREEYNAVKEFASALDKSWTSCEYQWLNYESSPRLILISKK